MARARSLTEFQQAFPDEERCAAFLFERRWPSGFVCPACGGRRAAALKCRAYTCECLDCSRQTSITAGTAMHRSKLPLTTWFWAAHLMATHSNGMSARQLEDQLGVTYKTAWLLAQKLRRSMIDPMREPLEGVVEIDQAEIPFRESDAIFEPGAAGKILVIGAVEVIDRDTNQARPRRKHAKYLDTRSGRIRLAAIKDNSHASIKAFVEANVKAWIDAAELSLIAARRMRPERVSRYFACLRRGLDWLVSRSITSTAPMTRILPAAPGSKKASPSRKGTSA